MLNVSYDAQSGGYWYDNISSIAVSSALAIFGISSTSGRCLAADQAAVCDISKH